MENTPEFITRSIVDTDPEETAIGELPETSAEQAEASEVQTLAQKLEAIQNSLPQGLRGSLPNMAAKGEELIKVAESASKEVVIEKKPAAFEETLGPGDNLPKGEGLEKTKKLIVVEIGGKQVQFIDFSIEELGLADSPKLSYAMGEAFLKKWSNAKLSEGHSISFCKEGDGIAISSQYDFAPNYEAALATKIDSEAGTKITMIGGDQDFDSSVRKVNVSPELRVGQKEKIIFRFV